MVLNVSVPASMQPNGTVQVEVTAINDSVVEFTETFYVSGEAAPPGVPVVFSEPAEVSILSEDGKCVVYCTYTLTHCYNLHSLLLMINA